mmetsp:Transcript_34842/g.67749  ORF Transcript_34842/g.67749 Transcript_34842/m.67749 type:complete len:94 (+) Transcript_34842:1-282(+)
MAFIVVGSAAKAIEAVVHLHCTMLGDPDRQRDIRISFSKKDPESVLALPQTSALSSAAAQPPDANTQNNEGQAGTLTPAPEGETKEAAATAQQ